jgi:hypothetical protein
MARILDTKMCSTWITYCRLSFDLSASFSSLIICPHFLCYLKISLFSFVKNYASQLGSFIIDLFSIEFRATNLLKFGMLEPESSYPSSPRRSAYLHRSPLSNRAITRLAIHFFYNKNMDHLVSMHASIYGIKWSS